MVLLVPRGVVEEGLRVREVVQERLQVGDEDWRQGHAAAGGFKLLYDLDAAPPPLVPLPGPVLVVGEDDLLQVLGVLRLLPVMFCLVAEQFADLKDLGLALERQI